MRKLPPPTRGPLHNDCSKPLKDASNTEIENSIAWYESKIVDWPKKYGRPVPQSFKDSLAVLKAERTNRMGK